MDLLQFDAGHLVSFLLVLARVSGVFFVAPILGSRNIPPQVKIGLSLMTAITLTPFISTVQVHPDVSIIELALLIGKEISVGSIIGFTATLVFMGFLLAGQIIDFQMGFGIVSVIDPLSNISVSLMGQFKNILAVLVFLTINGHHFLLSALSRSFDVVPLTTFALTPRVTGNFLNMVITMFVIALKVGGPAIGVLFITDLAMGMVARTVPQMNVFVVGMPLKIIIGFATVIAMLSFFFAYVLRIFDQMPAQLLDSIR